MKVITETTTVFSAIDKKYSLLLFVGAAILIGAVMGLIGGTAQPTIYLTGGLFVLIGIGTVLFRQQKTITIDKNLNEITIASKSLIKKSRLVYDVSSVIKLQLTSSYRTQHSTQSFNNNNSNMANRGLRIGTGGIGMGGTTSTQQITQLALLLRDGTSILIVTGQRSMRALGMISRVPNQDIGQRMADFIGVPFEIVGQESLGQTIADTVSAMRSNPQSFTPTPTVQSAPQTPTPTDQPAYSSQTQPPVQPNQSQPPASA